MWCKILGHDQYSSPLIGLHVCKRCNSFLVYVRDEIETFKTNYHVAAEYADQVRTSNEHWKLRAINEFV